MSRAARGWRLCAVRSAAVPGLCLLIACAGAPQPAVPLPEAGALSLERADRAYLLDPLAGYPLVVDGGREAALRLAYQALVEQGQGDRAQQVAEELLASDPGLHPAIVLRAQVGFARRELAGAATALRAVTQELPSYLAAQLLLGRVSEALGELPEAYAAYRTAGSDSSLAAERARELLPRSLEILGHRLDEALARGRLERAEELLATLSAWGPEDTLTLEAARRVAVAAADPEAELAAVTRLAGRFPGRRELVQRRAELELAVGDPATGLEIFTALAAAAPGDPELADQLEQARFRWRLTLLPERAQGAGSEVEIRRGAFAVLLYWLVPDVRYGRPEKPRIATDILEHRHRDEITRVINLGLMEVDPTLHHFSPEEPVTRLAALRALLGLLAGRAGGAPACLGPGGTARSEPAVCAAASRCQLLADPASCLPHARLSGPEAVELIRRALKQL